jgi:hypothetical protein
MSSENESDTNTETEKSMDFDDDSSDFGTDSAESSDYSDPDTGNDNFLKLKKESIRGKISKARFFFGINVFVLLAIVAAVLFFYYSGWLSFDNGFNSSIN